MLRFLHTADLQLGMPFHWVEGDAGSQLRQSRLDVLDRIAQLAFDRTVAFVLVAGDLFDSTTVDDRVVMQAVERLARFRVPLLVIPGNHDHLGDPLCAYNRSIFKNYCGSKLIVLEKPEPLVLKEHKCVVLPAPLRVRHEYGDTTRHITEEFGRSLMPDGYRIGLAHGSVPIIAPEDGGCINEIPLDRAERARLDYLALGDWHGTKCVADRTWYSGTPEPTSFKQNDPGNVLLVEISEPGTEPVVEIIRVAKTKWIHHAVELRSIADVESFESWVGQLEDRLHTLVDLELSGVLCFEDIARLSDVLQRCRGTFLSLRESGTGVLPKPTDAEFDAIARDGYVRTAVDLLREQAANSPQSPAADALTLLYQIKCANPQ